MEKVGVLIISHGSRDVEWVNNVNHAVNKLGKSYEIPIVSSYLEVVKDRTIQQGIDQLEQKGVTQMIVIPLFVSSGSTHIDEMKFAFGLKKFPDCQTNIKPFRINSSVQMSSPLNDDPIVIEMILNKLQALSIEPKNERVLIIAHGSDKSGFHEKWIAILQSIALKIKKEGDFSDVDYAMLLPDQSIKKLTDWEMNFPEEPVIVFPFFLSKGYFTKTEIPNRLKDFSYRYNGETILPHSLIEKWLKKQIHLYINKIV
ncbi:CbiX/SirB N-terminal domain-containing protein [Bacillus carboniphilus]|uniref:CbiX/SirB N-terminal domain-containing protein n=1 Tax=Bacillus carboniphilus TaxID=86663 RepID=A0ABY9K0K2_9BACI|nr:CbiX/SirB N-terminal domain-containing protein [Bacillus carboniphilus]WLR43385.1 CbiX/SirB N-terminal domain-containing protein [Bacillus carboniphilus]